jgi:hypothetical protein
MCFFFHPWILLGSFLFYKDIVKIKTLCQYIPLRIHFYLLLLEMCFIFLESLSVRMVGRDEISYHLAIVVHFRAQLPA